MLDWQTGHCVECLRHLTGMDFGWHQPDWEKWWRNEGSKLPPDELAKRAANKRAVRLADAPNLTRNVVPEMTLDEMNAAVAKRMRSRER